MTLILRNVIPVGLFEIPDVLLEMEEERGIVLDRPPAVHNRRQLGNYRFRGLRVGLLLLLLQSRQEVRIFPEILDRASTPTSAYHVSSTLMSENSAIRLR